MNNKFPQIANVWTGEIEDVRHYEETPSYAPGKVKRQRINTRKEISEICNALRDGLTIEVTSTGNPEGEGFIDKLPEWNFYFHKQPGCLPMFYRVKKEGAK